MAILGLAALLLVALGTRAVRNQNERDRITEESLARAKEALIAFAVSTVPNAMRIGDLPCPYPDDDGPQPPSCGNAAGTTGQSTRLGRLPWRDLGQDKLTDSSGETLWYAVSNSFKRSTSAGAINSETLGTITVRDSSNSIQFDASSTTGVVAVVIAPGPPLDSQRRGSVAERADPHNYLEAARGEDNADFVDNDRNGFIAGPVRDNVGNVLSNDRILVITRDELIAAVERRVGREALACLANYPGTIPWPAPLSVPVEYAGNVGTYFGRFPLSVANLNLSRSIGEIADRVDAARIALSAIDPTNPETEGPRKSAANTLLAVSRELVAAITVLDRVLSQLVLQVAAAADLLTGPTGSLARATRSTAQQRADNALAATRTVSDTMKRSGTDLFVPALNVAIGEMELASNPPRSGANSTAIANWAANVTSKTQALGILADEASVTDDDIRTAATVLKQSSVDAAATASQPVSTNDFVNQVSMAASATASAAIGLREAIAIQFQSINSLESRAAAYSRALSSFRALNSSQHFAPLAAAADGLNASINAFRGRTPAIQAAKLVAQVAIRNLVGLGAQSSLVDIGLAGTLVSSEANTLLTVVVADANDRGLNVALFHLNELTQSLETRRDEFVANPTNGNLTGLKQGGADLSAYIDQRIAGTAGRLDGVGSYVVLAQDLGESLVAAASVAVDAPSTQNIAAAETAAASAIPVARAVTAAVPALPGTGVDLDWDSQVGTNCKSSGWWGRSGWIDCVLYQITDPSHEVRGNLTVDGNGEYQIVVAVAGRRVSTQTRPSPVVSGYLEGTNAEASRNPPATAAVPGFAHGGLSPTFNDQLAY
ncbi:MAG: hypothetical protein WCF44_21730 [Candidatus Methylophosphatis roskildensis]